MRTDLPATWFRMYAEFATDPKVQMLSEANQRRFLMIMCLRCSNGSVTLQDSEVAFQLRISDDEWATTKAILIEKNLIGKDNRPTKWESRQFDSDTSNARVAKHRALQKAKQKEAGSGDVTLPKRKSSAPETETETEKDTPKPPTAPPDGFARFWSAYPKKVGKPAAEKAFRSAKLNGHLPEVLADIEAKAASPAWTKDGGQFIPNPATYLNQRRWEDQTGAPSPNLFAGAI